MHVGHESPHFDKKDEKIRFFTKKNREMFGSLRKTSYLCTAFERKRYHNKVFKALK